MPTEIEKRISKMELYFKIVWIFTLIFGSITTFFLLQILSLRSDVTDIKVKAAETAKTVEFQEKEIERLRQK